MTAVRDYAPFTRAERCWYCDDQPGEQCDACDDRRPLIAEINKLRSLLAGVAAALPTCPVCGGTRRVADNAASMAPDLPAHPCPDCTDGKVSLEQVVAENAKWEGYFNRCDAARVEVIAQRDAILATLPDCPTCGGTGTVRCDSCSGALVPCPDCDHGKVTVEQMAALWNDWHDLALSLTNVTEQHPRRSVRPPSPKEGT